MMVCLPSCNIGRLIYIWRIGKKLWQFCKKVPTHLSTFANKAFPRSSFSLTRETSHTNASWCYVQRTGILLVRMKKWQKYIWTVVRSHDRGHNGQGGLVLVCWAVCFNTQELMWWLYTHARMHTNCMHATLTRTHAAMHARNTHTYTRSHARTQHSHARMHACTH